MRGAWQRTFQFEFRRISKIWPLRARNIEQNGNFPMTHVHQVCWTVKVYISPVSPHGIR